MDKTRGVWRAYDFRLDGNGGYTEYMEECFYAEHHNISEPYYPVTWGLVQRIAENTASDRDWSHWCREPRPRRDMLLQRWQCPRRVNRR